MNELLKKLLFTFIEKQNFYRYRRFVIKLLSFKKNINTNLEIISFGNKEYDTFFGYYDINPFQKNKILYLIKNKKENFANIIIKDLENGNDKIIGKTSAWNWQQGARVRWCPNRPNCIMYNDFENNQFVTKIVNILNKNIEVIQCCLYDVDEKGQFGLTLDFLRLGVMRPGYGYTNQNYKKPTSLSEEGIFLVDISKKIKKKIITYDLISKVNGDNKNVSNYDNCYINHLSFSPSGKKFLFFWIQVTDANIHNADLLVYDIEKERLNILERELSVSHYDWIDDNSIIVTAYNKNRECRYYIYNVNGERKDFMHNFLTGDGHPTWLGPDTMITDTYVDKKGYQKILNVNYLEQKVEQLIDIYSTYKHSGERRCDLHPRVNEETSEICFDADVKGYRELFLMKGWNQI